MGYYKSLYLILVHSLHELSVLGPIVLRLRLFKILFPIVRDWIIEYRLLMFEIWSIYYSPIKLAPFRLGYLKKTF